MKNKEVIIKPTSNGGWKIVILPFNTKEER
jgi:hypothetical protein